MVLELAFDPSSKFLAAGTADSHIKVFDAVKGFQTHNFTGGHRGIITNLTFFPEKDTLLLISSAEDCQVKVWDLVMRAEIAHLKGHTALITSIGFTSDMSTLITCAKDGKLGFWNVKENFASLSLFKYSKAEEELNVVHFFEHQDSPYVIIGGASGSLSIFDINQAKQCFQQRDTEYTSNEVTKIFSSKVTGKVWVLNSDQQLTEYEVTGKKTPKLRQTALNCLYLDEIIDVRLLRDTDDSDTQPTKAVICSNNELLKVVDLATGKVEQSPKEHSHSDIILCVDAAGRDLFVTGSKDNSIRLWRYTPEGKLVCLAVFTGHNENVASVCFAPKRNNFFVSAS